SKAELVDRIRTEGVRIAASHSTWMRIVITGTEAGGQPYIAGVLLVIVHLIAVPGKEHVLCRGIEIETNIEVVVVLGIELLTRIVVQHVGAGVVWRGKSIQIVHGSLIQAPARNHIG